MSLLSKEIQMSKLQSQPTPNGSQPLSEDEICETVLGKRPSYSKGLGWGPKHKSRKTLNEQLRIEKGTRDVSFTSGTYAKAYRRHEWGTTRTTMISSFAVPRCRMAYEAR
ncbi:zinc finger protein ZPR1-like protein [Cucumis melo var. makuwa]|uniref:Zinc finger protein ZPR1-like protein n=1 Tax=Cucumis melo var. makuwa TaxID=1194695 RepID=A0A5D3CCT1_CUCMM|nr:zinc finger protein ZPR1-like protein [Cucumis melo var. makuwa]